MVENIAEEFGYNNKDYIRVNSTHDEYFNRFKDVHFSLAKVLENIVKNGYGVYAIEFYFYIEGEGCSDMFVVNLYTQDFFDKDRYNKVVGGVNGHTVFAYRVCTVNEDDCKKLHGELMDNIIIRIKDLIETDPERK